MYHHDIMQCFQAVCYFQLTSLLSCIQLLKVENVACICTLQLAVTVVIVFVSIAYILWSLVDSM